VPHVPEELRAVAEGITQNRRQIASVRTLLLWFGFNGRNNQTNQQVQQALEFLKLKTDPDFTSAGIDDNITFVPKYDTIREPTGAVGTDVHMNVGAIVAIPGNGSEGSAYRIGKLPSARKTPVSVSSETTTEEVVTLMLVRDFSQLVVVNTDKEVVGLVSWKSLGSRLALGKRCRVAGDFTEKHPEVGAETSVFDAIPLIVDHGCVLVRDSSGKVRGIVTASDLAVKFSQFGEPFLLLEEIENQVRGIIGAKFTREQLEAACDPHDSSRSVDGIADLRFDEYIRLLDHPDRWDRLGLDIDRRMFIRGLEQISRIRGEVMHFDAAGIKEEDLGELRTFAQFLRQLRLLVS
jgi:CBS domain-containing protein